jgi:predicted nucleic acid-binding protein
VVEQGEKRAGARKVDQADWITVHDVKNREMVQILVLGTVGILVWAK